MDGFFSLFFDAITMIKQTIDNLNLSFLGIRFNFVNIVVFVCVVVILEFILYGGSD